ncbi:hypothetical protein ACVXHB_05675 [Escherichia coli]
MFNALNTIKAVIVATANRPASWCSIFPLFSQKLKAAFGVCYSRRRN